MSRGATGSARTTARTPPATSPAGGIGSVIRDHRRTHFRALFIRQRQAAPPRGSARPQPSWTACPTPDQQTRTAVTRRITAHVRRGWPRLGEPIVRHRRTFTTSPALLPGYREPAPILRLRCQGSADRWAIGIYLRSDRYTESELPTSFGPKTGTPEEGVDDTFILYAGPKTGRLRPSARTRPRPQKCETRADTTGPSPSGVPSWRGCVLPEDDSAGYRETSTAAVVIIPGEDG
jgi:hypothetical protein